jgi:hypothetical protein
MELEEKLSDQVLADMQAHYDATEMEYQGFPGSFQLPESFLSRKPSGMALGQWTSWRDPCNSREWTETINPKTLTAREGAVKNVLHWFPKLNIGADDLRKAMWEQGDLKLKFRSPAEHSQTRIDWRQTSRQTHTTVSRLCYK